MRRHGSLYPWDAWKLGESMFSIPVLDGLVVGLKGKRLPRKCTMFERQNKGWAKQDSSGTAGNPFRVSHQSFIQSLRNQIAYSTSILQQQLHPATTSRMDIRPPKLRGSARLFLPTLRAPAVAGMAGDLSERPTSQNADSRQARQQLHLLLPALERPTCGAPRGWRVFTPYCYHI